MVDAEPPRAGRVYTTMNLLLRLDDWDRPGLSIAEFVALFKRCTCGMITTTRVFGVHFCLPSRETVPTVSASIMAGGRIRLIDKTTNSEHSVF